MFQAAQDTLDQLGLDPTRRIDVFDAIDRFDLVLLFQPMENLLGVVVPTGGGGVLITSRRPLSVQRYTAAHEIGHWVLDHDELVLDGDAEITGPARNQRERRAQLFASYFLMPPPLVRGTAARHGLRPGGTATPSQAYLIARDVGASYEAVVRQLFNLQYFGADAVAGLLKVPVMTAKRQAAHGVRPLHGGADVWPLGEADDGVAVEVVEGDEVVISLPENLTTGYRWLTPADEAKRAQRRPAAPPPALSAAPPRRELGPLAPPRGRGAAAQRALRGLSDEPPSPRELANDGPLVEVQDEHRPGWTSDQRIRGATVRRAIAGSATHSTPITGADARRPGSSVGTLGRRVVVLRAQEEGAWSYRLVMSRPFDAAAAVAGTFTLLATVRPHPVTERRRRLLDVDLDAPGPDDPDDEAVFMVHNDRPSPGAGDPPQRGDVLFE